MYKVKGIGGLLVGDKLKCKRNFFYNDDFACCKDNFYVIRTITDSGIFQIKDETNQNLYFTNGDSPDYTHMAYLWAYFYTPDELLKELRLKKLKQLEKI